MQNPKDITEDVVKLLYFFMILIIQIYMRGSIKGIYEGFEEFGSKGIVDVFVESNCTFN